MRVAVASRNVEELNGTVDLLRSEGPDGIAVPTDVTDEQAVRQMIAATKERLGSIDLLINCAGLGGPFGPTWEVDSQMWWRNTEVNLKGPLLTCQAVLKGMIDRRQGCIVNVASGAGTVGIPYMSAM